MNNKIRLWFILITFCGVALVAADVIYIKNPDGSISKQETLSAQGLADRRTAVVQRLENLRDTNTAFLNEIQLNQAEMISLNAELIQIDAATVKP